MIVEKAREIKSKRGAEMDNVLITPNVSSEQTMRTLSEELKELWDIYNMTGDYDLQDALYHEIKAIERRIAYLRRLN
jgi:hypothetical protein